MKHKKNSNSIPDFQTITNTINNDESLEPTFSNLVSYVSQLNAKNLNQITSEENEFLEILLSRIIKLGFRNNKIVNDEIQPIINLYNEMIKTAIKFDFNEKKLKAILSPFLIVNTNIVEYQVSYILDARIVNFDTLVQQNKTINLLSTSKHVHFVKALFDLNFFKEFLDKYSNDQLSKGQIIILLDLITMIQPYLHESMFLTLINLIFNKEYQKYTVSKEYDINVINFFSFFIKNIPSQIGIFFGILCEIITRSENEKIVKIIKIVQSCLKMISFPSPPELFITNIIKILETNTYPSVIEAIYSILRIETIKHKFTLEEMSIILPHAISMPKETGQLLSIISKNINNNFDKFSIRVLTYQVFYPAFHFILIDKTEDPQICKALFHQLMQTLNFRTELETIYCPVLSEKVINLIIEEIESEPDFFHVLAVGCLLVNYFRLDIMMTFVDQIAKVKEIPADFNSLMIRLAYIIDISESKEIFNKFRRSIQRALTIEHPHPSLHSVVVSFVDWITVFSFIPEENMIEDFKLLDFRFLNHEMTLIINAVIERTPKPLKSSKLIKLIKELVFKIISDTVPPVHANWIMTLGFKYHHEDRKDSDKVIEQLIINMNDYSKRTNAIHMLKWAAYLESDYLDLGKTFTFKQPIRYEYDGKKYQYNIYIHPFNSMRKLFNQISMVFASSEEGEKTKSLKVFLGEKELRKDSPLTSLQFSQINPLVLNIDFYDGVGEELFPLDFSPLYLSSLKSKNYSEQMIQLITLYSLMEDFSDESLILFQILTLFDPPELEYKPNPLQLLYRRDFLMSIEYLTLNSIFPFVIRAAELAEMIISDSYVEFCLDVLTRTSFDSVSLAIACNSLPKLLSEPEKFPLTLVKKCLIDSNYESIRIAFMNMYAPDQEILSLIHLTVLKENRSKTKQFFKVIKKLKPNPEIFKPFFINLEQFETSFYSDIDETFIGMIKNLEHSEDLIELTFDRLFSPPTVRDNQLPFLQTIESRREAFKYLGNYDYYNLINPLLDCLPFSKTTRDRPLSEDMTFTGRCIIEGIGPSFCLSSILHQLCSMQYFMKMILSFKHVSPFVEELRTFLAKLKYSRNKYVSAKKLASFPQTETLLRTEDKDLFPTLIKMISEGTSEKDSMKEMFQLEISTQKDDIIIETQHLNQISFDLSSFINNALPDGMTLTKFSIAMYKLLENKIVSHWPIYLIIHFDRHLSTSKVSGEFEFPLYFENYKIIGAVAHDGQTKRGKFMSFCESNKEWILCQHDGILYFDLADLSAWTKGEPDDLQFQTASHLVYQRIDYDKDHDIEIQPALEEEINKENAKIWPNVVCNSNSFVNFIRDTAENDVILFKTLVKIVIIDSDSQLVNDFIECIKDRIKKSKFFISTICRFEIKPLIILPTISPIFPQLICDGIKGSADLKNILNRLTPAKSIDESEMIFYIFNNMSKEINLDAEVILISLKLIKLLWKYKHSPNSYQAFDTILSKARDIYMNEPKLLKQIVSEDWGDIGMKSTILRFLTDIEVKEKTEEKEAKQQEFCFSDIIENASITIFHKNKEIRQKTYSLIVELMEEPNQTVIDYINTAIISKKPVKYNVVESSLGHLLLLMIPADHPKQEQLLDYYLEFVEKLCLLCPRSFLTYSTVFINLLLEMKEEVTIIKLGKIVHHIIALDRTIQLPSAAVQKILDCRMTGIEAVQLLYLLHDEASGSNLLSSCIEDRLNNFYDENTEILIKMLDERIEINSFELPKTLPDMMCLNLLNTIFLKFPKHKKKIQVHLKTLTKKLKNMSILSKSQIVRDAIKYAETVPKDNSAILTSTNKKRPKKNKK